MAGLSEFPPFRRREMSLLENIQEMIGERGMSQIARHVGGDEQSIDKALSAALPTLLGAMGRKADSDDGQGLLNSFLRDDDDSPEDSHEFFENKHHEKQDLNPLLDGLFGNKRQKVEDGIGKASGLSSGQAGGLMKMLAPLVISYLGKKALKGGSSQAGGGSVFDIIKSAGQEAEEESGRKSGGMIGRLLDQDGDGDFDFSDVAKLGLGFLRRK